MVWGSSWGTSWGSAWAEISTPPEVILIERYDIMGSARTSINDFATGNPIYANAVVTAYTIANGAKSSIKATLYSSISGSGALANPQTLDSHGKFKQPVYIQEPVILTITGLKNTPDHDTGILSVINILSGTGSPEGVVTADVSTLYLREDGVPGETLYVKESGAGSTGWVAK